MASLTKRVQLLLDPEQFEQLEKTARDRGTSVGALIREAVDEKFSRITQEMKLDAVKRIASMNVPVGDWEEVEKDIERGYLREECDLP